MSDITQPRLFDVTEFGGDEPTPSEVPKTKERIDLPIEEWLEPWTLLRNRQGVMPYFHLEESRSSHGAVVTVCGVIGTKITPPGVGQMIRCQLCDMGAQLAKA